MLVDPDNDDFRPTWGSHLHRLDAGAYDADDSNPWTAGIEWTYSRSSNYTTGCMHAHAQNYNSAAVFSDGSCILPTLSSSPANISLEAGLTMTPHTLTYETPFLADDKQTAASSGAVGMGTNIALDSNGAVHICSKIESSGDLYYTTNASGSWQSATLDSAGNVGGDCFIIFDSDDDIHITYHDDSNNNLKYATKALSSAIAASNWDISTMDNNGDVGNFGSMAVDADDTLHVAYHAVSGTVLKYATLTDGSSTWSREVVESTNDVGTYTSLALDSNGNPHITYYDDTNDDLRYTHKMGSTWAFTTLDSVGDTGKGSSLAIDSNDHLHVAYKTNSTETAYMTNRSGSWVKTTLDTNSTGNWGVNYIDIMIDEDDDVHVVYSDMVDYDIFYMSNTRGVWERTLVAGDSISKTSSATMDQNGGIHVGYYIDGSFDDVGYAAVRSFTHRPQYEIEPALPTGLSLGDENGTIYGTPSVRQDSKQYTVWANTTYTSAIATFSMSIDWQLTSSVDEIVGILNKAIEPITFTESLSDFDFGTWSTGVSNGTTAFSQSWRKPSGAGTDANYDFQDFAIAENGDQAIVFTQNHSGGSTPHSLALMYKPFNGSWSSSIIDNSTNTGFKPSIAIDRTGALHIAYIDNANDTIRYTTNVSGSWVFSTLGDADWTDSHSRKTDIAIDPITDAVYIVHTMKDVGDSGSALEGARFHTNEGGSWVNETITHRGLKSGYDSQIALDSDGNIHVAYYLDQGSDLKIASRINGVWQNETIAGSTASSGSNFNAGNTPAIAIDSQDVIHIISMTNYGSSNKRLALYSGTLGSWTATTFGTTSLYRHSYNPSIAIDSNDAIHIAYHYASSSKHLHYISNMTGSWSLETLDSSNAGWGARVSIDNNDDIHIAHSDLVGSGQIGCAV